MNDRETLTSILRRWETFEQEWNDRASARLQDTCLQPLAEQSRLLERQQEDIQHFLARMDAELETLQSQYQN